MIVFFDRFFVFFKFFDFDAKDWASDAVVAHDSAVAFVAERFDFGDDLLGSHGLLILYQAAGLWFKFKLY